MSKLTKNFTKNFTITDNRVAQCGELDLNAKGLYFYIASLPDDWDFSIERIARANNTTEGKVKSAIEQLERVGLLQRTYELNANGKRGVRADYEIFDFDTRLENSSTKISTPKNSRIEKLGAYINNNNTKKESHKESILQTPYNPPKPQSKKTIDLKAIKESFERVRELYKTIKSAKSDLYFQLAEQEFFKIVKSGEIDCGGIIRAMEQQVELWSFLLKNGKTTLQYIPRLERWLSEKSYFQDFDTLLEPYKEAQAKLSRGSQDWGSKNTPNGKLSDLLKM